MGILGLAKLIGDYAPSAVKENEFKSYFGKIICRDNDIFTLNICMTRKYQPIIDCDGPTKVVIFILSANILNL